jgi:hypothetical protein
MSKPKFQSLGFAALDWIEHFLVHGPGDVQGQQIELDDEFSAFIIKGYEVHPTGERKVRRAFLSRPKGRSKSGLAAFVACFEALGPARFDHWATEGETSYWGYEYQEGEPVGKPLTYVEILCVATEEGQAGNTYDAIYYALNPDTCSENLLDEFGRLDVGLTRINMPGRRGFIEPVTSADSSADGGKSTFIVADETHLWTLPRLKRLHGIMTRNLLKRKVASGWMLETSTMYADGDGSVAEGTHAYATSRNDKTLLFDHRQAADHWDLTKRDQRLKALAEAYGPAAEWMNLDAISDSWDDPQTTEADFRRYWLNQPVPTSAPIPSVLPNWHECESAAPPPRPAAIAIAVSIDRAWASIGACGIGARPHLGAVKRERGTAWVVAEAKRIQDEHHIPVVVDGKGPAESLIEKLEVAGVVVLIASTDDYLGACADLIDRVDALDVEHAGYDDLDDAVAAAAKRMVGERVAWARKFGDVSMLEAVTLALWGALNNTSIYESRGMVVL